jgi:PKD repeat protein
VSRVHRFALGAILGVATMACEDLPPVPPVASFIYTPVSPIYAGRTEVVFNASPSVAVDGRIVSFGWDFGDGTPVQEVSSATTTHVFRGDACNETTYAVLLTVTDESRERASTSQNVRVQPVLPLPATCP